MSPDAAWEQLKARSRRLQLADATVDQTHVHHALITVLVFGSLGAAVSLLRPESTGDGLRFGFMAGWAFYMLRELWNRRSNWRFRIWDGACDIVIPLWVTAPVVFNSPELLWALSVLVVLLYFFLRPIE